MRRKLSLPASKAVPLDLVSASALTLLPLLLFRESSEVGVGGECSMLGVFAPSRDAFSCDTSD